MDTISKQFSGYNNGYQFWQDNEATYGFEEAFRICGRYLEMQMKQELSQGEREFCRGVYADMHEAATYRYKELPARLVYPYDFKTASDRAEVDYY